MFVSEMNKKKKITFSNQSFSFYETFFTQDLSTSRFSWLIYLLPPLISNDLFLAKHYNNVDMT